MGRWHKPNVTPRLERKCQLCNILEDEYHFIFECPLYFELRQNLLKRYYWKRPNMPKFIELFMSDNKTIVQNLAMYIHKSMEKRNDMFYRV